MLPKPRWTVLQINEIAEYLHLRATHFPHSDDLMINFPKIHFSDCIKADLKLSSSLVRIPNQINPIHILISYFFNFILILSSQGTQ
jgi:hypothetical protein